MPTMNIRQVLNGTKFAVEGILEIDIEVNVVF